MPPANLPDGRAKHEPTLQKVGDGGPEEIAKGLYREHDIWRWLTEGAGNLVHQEPEALL